MGSAEEEEAVVAVVQPPFDRSGCAHFTPPKLTPKSYQVDLWTHLVWVEKCISVFFPDVWYSGLQGNGASRCVA